MESGRTLLEVKDLTKHFPVGRGLLSKGNVIHAVDGVSFTVGENETLGLVGESGCGKTTCGRLIVGLEKPTSGKIEFMGSDVVLGSGKIQMVFQDSSSSLNPRKTLHQILAQAYRISPEHAAAGKEEVEEGIVRLLETVGLVPPQVFLGRFPHELSGGQRQRVGIARSITTRPKFIVADEPVSALDVSVQAQIIMLMRDLQKQLGLSYLFITHNLTILKTIAHRVAVMYLGRIVELCDTEDLYRNPLHPYTQALLYANPPANPKVARSRVKIVVGGELPSPMNPPKGCRFHTRCQYAHEKCMAVEPVLTEVEKNHFVACHLV